MGTFLYLLLHVALSNSYGSINHGTHVLLYVSFALLFLPRSRRNQPRTRRDVLICLNVFWLIQVVLLLPYTLSGFWKVWNSGIELLSPDALSRILLNRLLAEADDIPPLMPLVSQHELLTYAMWLLTIYIEVFAILVVFRPHLHRPFGIVLILFHIISDWLMNIAFPNHIILLGLFLVLSPLAPVRPVVLWLDSVSADHRHTISRAGATSISGPAPASRPDLVGLRRRVSVVQQLRPILEAEGVGQGAHPHRCPPGRPDRGGDSQPAARSQTPAWSR